MADRPKLQTPEGTCDTHIHIYDSRYPSAPTAAFTPPDALVPDYQAVKHRLGIGRTIVVQPSTYGTDNRCTLDAIAALGAENARGVAIVDETVDEAELENLMKGGIRGARFHMLTGAPIPWERLDGIAARVQRAGWHLQLQLDGRDLPDRQAQVRSWPGCIVIDHVGKFLEPVAPDHPAFRCLLGLVDTGRVWIKLSGAYEVSKRGPPLYDDVGALAKALVKAAPERMLWATNWPHPSVQDKPDDAALLDILLEWAPDEATRRRILVDNPAELYGF